MVSLAHTERELTDFMTVKQHNPYCTNGNAGIGDVEHRAEKNEVLSTDKGHPLWPVGFNDWEIEHVYHLAHHEWGIARAERNGK